MCYTQKTLLQDSYYVDEILKILKLKTIARKSLYSTDISAHMRMRDTQTTQKTKKKTRMKQRDITIKLDRNVARIDWLDR